MRGLEAFFVGKRGKHHTLKRFKRGRVFRPRRRDR
jgi:hypothetical protein